MTNLPRESHPLTQNFLYTRSFASCIHDMVVFQPVLYIIQRPLRVIYQAAPGLDLENCRSTLDIRNFLAPQSLPPQQVLFSKLYTSGD